MSKPGLRAAVSTVAGEPTTLLCRPTGLDVLPTSPATFLTAGAASSHLQQATASHSKPSASRKPQPFKGGQQLASTYRSAAQHPFNIKVELLNSVDAILDVDKTLVFHFLALLT